MRVLIVDDSAVVRQSLVKIIETDPMLEVTTIDASAYEAGTLIDLTTPSLFDEPRLVIIENVERCTDDGQAWEIAVSCLRGCAGGAQSRHPP